jgi:hypothetical protein
VDGNTWLGFARVRLPIASTNTARTWSGRRRSQIVHAVLYLAWVGKGSNLGSERAQTRIKDRWGVYVIKPHGRLGTAYVAAIAPFRHRIVYPALMREIGRAYREQGEAQ